MITLGELFDIQRNLQEKVVAEKGIDIRNEPDKLVVATLVEISECANEWRGFKIWSTNQKQTDHALEEYVDGLHFILIMGLVIDADRHFWGLDYNSEELRPVIARKAKNVEQQFLEVYEHILYFGKYGTVHDWKKLFENYMGLGKMLGFTPKQIIDAYLEKNKVNHKRQESGY